LGQKVICTNQVCDWLRSVEAYSQSDLFQLSHVSVLSKALAKLFVQGGKYDAPNPMCPGIIECGALLEHNGAVSWLGDVTKNGQSQMQLLLGDGNRMVLNQSLSRILVWLGTQDG
jgi:hypothetical protein